MAATSKSRSNGPVLPLTLSFRSLTQPPPLQPPPQPPPPSLSDQFSSSVFDHRPSSPTRVNLSPTSFRISINNRSLSPTTRATVTHTEKLPAKFKRTCLCSPSTHPGSFKCALHRNNNNNNNHNSSSISCSPSRLNLRRSAMTNSLVRIGTVEGDWVRRALTALIRPSSHQQRRRFDFCPRPSRLSVMSKASDLL